jgi:hypothetical protein
MTLAEVQPAQMGEGVEVLEEGLGDGGEVGAPTDVVQVGDQLAADSIDPGVAGVQEPVGFEELQVSRELFTIEIREGLALVFFHSTSAGGPTLVDSNVVHFAEGCQEM